MIPALTGIDHYHVYVPDRDAAADWYAEHLGFHVIEQFRVWADEDPGGPLVIGDASGNVHLALFSTDEPRPSSSPALGCSGDDFVAWHHHLRSAGLLDSCADHGLAWSLYFSDPYGNRHEITSYELEPIRAAGMS